MATPGWYPDPSGQPGSFRYWDGAAWSSQTSSNPSGPPPGSPPPARPTPPAPQQPYPPAAPTQLGQSPGAAPYGQPGSPSGAAGGAAGGAGGGWSQPPAPPSWSSGGSSSGGGRGKTIGVVLGVVVLVVALGVGTFFLVQSLGDDGGDSASDDPSSATDDPTSDPTSDPTTETTSEPSGPITADPTSPACVGGKPDSGGQGVSNSRLEGGGLSAITVPRVKRSFKIGGEKYTQDGAFDFADGITSLSMPLDASWITGYALGSLDRSRGYTDPQQAAETALSCLEQSDNYKSLTGRTDTGSEAITVDGHDAWKITSELTVSDSGPSGVPGDDVVLVVVDTGDPDTFGLYVNYIPIGYDDLVGEQDQVTQSLQVDG